MSDLSIQPKRTLTVFSLVMITTGIITSIHGAPSMAEYGLSLIVIYLVVALVFLLPAALISAELATGWPEDGGVYVWVREAFGEQLGFVAVWQQWVENVIWFPSILTVTVVTAFYGFDRNLIGEPGKESPTFIFLTINVVFWALTISNLFGMRTSGLIASICTLFGRILPILFMSALAIFYLQQGHESQTSLTWDNLVPDLSDFGLLSFIVGAFLTFAGIEASASNAASARNPRRNYPIAIIVSACVALVLVTIVALAIAIVVPREKIDLDAGIMQAIRIMLETSGLGGLLPLAGLVIALGMLGEVNNWIPAPTRGLLVAGRDGALARFWQRENAYSAHWRILTFQAMLVTAISTMYLFFQVQVAFWIMNVVPTMIYVLMYILMFAAGVRLRYKHPEVPRRYRVPLGNVGMWGLAVIGSIAGTIAIAFAFIPPSLVPAATQVRYTSVVTVGFLMFSTIPFLIWAFRRPEWKTNMTDPHSCKL